MTTKRVLPIRDIQFGNNFDGEKMRRLIEALALMADELRRMQNMLDGGDPGQALIKNSSKDYDADWDDAGGGGAAGEANDGANVGTGQGVFRDKSGVTLNFRSVRGGSGISVSLVGDDIEISASAGSGNGYPAVLGHAGI